VRKYLQIGFALALGLFLLFFPVAAKMPWLDPMKILGLTMTFIGFAFWYFDGRLTAVLTQIEEDLKDHVLETSLADAMKSAGEIKKHWESIRILATSTGQIQPLFESSGMTARNVSIIMRKIEDAELSLSPGLIAFKQSIDHNIVLWRDLEKKKQIGKLVVYQYPFFPLEYNVIFEDKFLISGLLYPEFGRFSEVNVQNPTIIRNNTRSGTREVGKYIARFDQFFEYIRVAKGE
jgi:hypothetical protein